MYRARDASEQLHHQRASRLRALRAEIARLAALHERALARASPQAAHIATRLRRAEASLAALERTIAAEPDATPPP